MSGMPRLGLAAAALLVAAAIVLAWAAGVTPGSPWSSGQRLDWPGARFQPVMGQGRGSPGGMRVTQPAEDHSALQTLPLRAVEAAQTPFLRYQFKDFPRTLELALVFRRSDSPRDVEVIALPWPGERTNTVDLRRVEGWGGAIIELGFAQFPTAQLVPEERGFAAFTLEHAALWSPSWQASLAALGTQWLERRPWQLISASALGPRSVTDRAVYHPRLPLVVALLVGLLGLAIVAARGLSRAALLRMALLTGAMGWLVVDAAWLRDLMFKARTDADIWSDIPLPQRQENVFASDVQAAATSLKRALEDADPGQRVVLYGGSTFESLSLAYRAAPLNIGLLSQNHANVPVPDNTVVVGWQTREDAADGTLRLGSSRTPVATLAVQDGMRIFRVEWPADVIFQGNMSQRSDQIFADGMAARPADRIRAIGHERTPDASPASSGPRQ